MKKAVMSILSGAAGLAVGAGVIGKVKADENIKIKNMSDKHLALMLLFNQWMITKQQGKSIIDYFMQENIKSVAIYGMSYVGERLYDELKDSEIEVKYVIDKNANSIYAEVDVLTPEDVLPVVDAIVVTPVYFYDEIKEEISEKTNAVILSLEDILYGL